MRKYSRLSCDVRNCNFPKFYVGKDTAGLCRDHYLTLPAGWRREWGLTEKDSPERLEIEQRFMELRIQHGDACAHYKYHNDATTPKDSESRCLICHPPTAKEGRNGMR